MGLWLSKTTAGVDLVGGGSTVEFLISVAICKKASSTFWEVLADVSMKENPQSSANAFALAWSTTRLLARSAFVPTSNLRTLPVEYLSISASQSLT